MPEGCSTFRDLLVADTLHELGEPERAALAAHLDACAGCREHHRVLREDDRRLSAFVGTTDAILARLEDRIRHEIAAIAPPLAADRRQRFASSGGMRLAFAAVLVAVILLGINVLDHGGGGGVVWAEVLAQVEEADAYICRRIEQRAGERPQEIVEYRSAAFGLRQDIYENGQLQAVQFLVPQEHVLYALIHRDRTYLRQELSEEQVAEMLRQGNAREIVRGFRDHEHHNLGRRRIAGKSAEGIEITDSPEWLAIFERGSWRLWVDVATQWPVRIELEGIARGGGVRKTYTLKDFQWNPRLSAQDFAVEIPADYRLIAELSEVEATEAKAVAGLRAYAGLLGGRYPSSLSLATAIAEAEQQLDARHDGYDAAAGRDLEALFSLRSTCSFYRDLVTGEHDAAYHGESVTARDFDRVLLRWRLDDGSYRVVYGDLRAEIVTAARLAELERRR